MSQIVDPVSEADNLQDLVDRLAETLGRSVAVDKPTLELICSSAHFGVVDERRIAAVIDRAPPPEPLPWLLSFGFLEAEDPVRIPGHDGYKMLPRVVFPVRHNGVLCSLIWLFDIPDVSEDEIAYVRQFESRIADLTHLDGDSTDARVSWITSLASDLLLDKPSALSSASSKGLLPIEGKPRVHAIQFEWNTGENRQLSIAVHALQRLLSRPLARRTFLTLDADASLLVIERARQLADSQTVLREIVETSPLEDLHVRSIGSAFVPGGESFSVAARHARFMAEVASLLGRGSQSLCWEDSGAWRLLFGRTLDHRTVFDISPDAKLLIEAGPKSHWQTVLAYLDFARNTTRTGESLYIHRATLHYRMQRARELLEPEALEDGWRATALHVALKLYSAIVDEPHAE